MSRIGKKPVEVPANVKVAIAGQNVTVEGPLGKLELAFRPEVAVAFDDAARTVTVSPTLDSRAARAMHGLYRALIQNMVVGVTQGYEKKLEIFGTGYMMVLVGSVLQIRAGFANEIHLDVPEGVKVKTESQQALTVSGIDKQAVTQFAAEIRAVRKAEPYLGKGIKYAGEIIRRKESKAAAKK